MKKMSEKKTTNEKPISLYPLGFKEAVAALLKVKPETKEEKGKEKKDTPNKK
jgi:hypothetical protein